MKRLLLLLVVLAGAVAAAAFTVPTNAANVNGQTISQSALNSDLAAIAGSPEYQCALNAEIVVQSRGQAGLPPVNGVGTGTYDSTFVSYWLSRMVDDTLLQQLAARRGVVLTASQLSSARTEALQSLQTTINDVAGSQYQCQVTPSSVLASVPSSFSDKLITAQAYNDLLVDRFASDTTDAALRRYFAAHASDFDTLCVSGILVQTQDQANQLRSQIEAGASFSQIASTDSQDASSAAKGGDLGCFPATSSSYASVKQDVGSLSLGDVTEPIASSGGGYVLIKLDARDPTQYASARSAVRAAVRATNQQRAAKVLSAAAGRAQVDVNPMYGNWHAATAARGVLPPPSPPTSSVLSPQANQPTYPAASGGTSGASG